MATIVTRAGKGSALTHSEMDANFNNLNNDKAELSGSIFTGTVTNKVGADVASSGILTLGTGNVFDITGTTAITSISTVGIGTIVTLQFDDVLTLTHNATDLILPSGANISTAAGDIATFYEYATGDWRCINYSRATGTPLTDVGVVVMRPIGTVPSGELECDGTAVSRTTYAALFAYLGTDYGVGDGSTTFNLPDYRGTFLRGWDNTAGNDPDAGLRTDRGDGTTGDVVGSKQDGQSNFIDDIRANDTAGGASSITITDDGVISAYLAVGDSTADGGGTAGLRAATRGVETRPDNINIMYCIRY